jgi:hypothetical protein
MTVNATDAESVAILKRLIAQIGTGRLLALLSDLARQHADDLVTQGDRADMGRFMREATILAKASEAMGD